MSRVMLISEEDEHKTLILAQQITRHIPQATICGIVYVTRARFVSCSGSGPRLFSSTLGCWLFGLIHGGRPKKSNSFIPDLRCPIGECRGINWNILSTQHIDNPEVFRYVNQGRPDLILTFQVRSIPSNIAVLANRGTVQGVLTHVKGNSDEPSLCSKVQADLRRHIEIRHITRNGEDLLLDFDLSPQPLDSATSLELKSHLILRDLLVQSAAAVVQHSEVKPSHRVRAWAAEMIPSCFRPHRCSPADTILYQVPPLRIRPKWKLCIYSLFLLSPFIVLRNWFRRLRRQHPIVFLNSHLVSDREHRMSLPTEAFYCVVRFLKRHYRIVSLSEAVRLLKSGNIQEPTVVLTFDDGYEDNFVNLRAVSEEMGIPVVLFVSSDPVTGRREFAHDYERGLKGFRALSWNQIRYWAADTTEFQSHTCSHFDCGSSDAVLLQQEMFWSKRILEEQLGSHVTSLAFPFGKPENMSPAAVTIAQQTYDHFFSCFGGENYPNRFADHKHLFRKHLSGNSWECELALQGVFDILEPLGASIRIGLKRLLARHLHTSPAKRLDMSAGQESE
jgi:peptidoglycan/xylan/chitin deacetylase (PgdA/CDA1 family)